MPRPRVFVSSTYYDLKHLRSSLENFVDSLGFDAVLSEKGKIAYTPDAPLDESCYKEVGNADIFVLVVGGRYGSEVSATKSSLPKTFFERYNSITRGEYRAAVERNTPMYVLIERAVYAEYETYLKNKDNESIRYAHVDSANIFRLIEDILGQDKNNPVFQFDRYAEIEAWLREQWAGLFRELLHRIQTQAQLSSLQAEVAQLGEMNRTLKTYLEAVVSRVAPAESDHLIRSETKRLRKSRSSAAIRSNSLGKYLISYKFAPESLIEALVDSTDAAGFLAKLAENAVTEDQRVVLSSMAETDTLPFVERDTGELRDRLLGNDTQDVDSPESDLDAAVAAPKPSNAGTTKAQSSRTAQSPSSVPSTKPSK